MVCTCPPVPNKASDSTYPLFYGTRLGLNKFIERLKYKSKPEHFKQVELYGLFKYHRVDTSLRLISDY